MDVAFNSCILFIHIILFECYINVSSEVLSKIKFILNLLLDFVYFSVNLLVYSLLLPFLELGDPQLRFLLLPFLELGDPQIHSLLEIGHLFVNSQVQPFLDLVYL